MKNRRPRQGGRSFGSWRSNEHLDNNADLDDPQAPDLLNSLRRLAWWRRFLGRNLSPIDRGLLVTAGCSS